MNQSLWTRFLLVSVTLVTLGFVVSAFLTPPDPYTQILTVPVILLVAIPLSYWIVYKRGLPV
ncbi:DUF7534 family protein [Halopelagius longus]|uniref:Uncharacterized protein n=1 Tax=Halopelagius longus TaxID=1236180 RepID=A0A1H1C153_9EURY|nr:hypothetical protein [Halopelagius longus]RDI71018.1 hypothetical protein DWB78_04340 [Halopelagius longus]SDQ57923.1 hypothetical protein SAMN05216278_2059 [Halopelagius longus]